MRLPAKIKKLNKRERYAVMGAAIFFALFLIVTFIVGPFFNRTSHLKRNLQTKAAMVEQMRQLQAEYLSLTQKEKISKAQFLRREKEFKLYPFLNRLAGETGIKDHIGYMRPSTRTEKDSPYKISRVEMQLESITLDQLTSYLYGVETSKNMVDIKKLSISKKDKKQGLITAVLQVETIEI
jgi:general secretion pathway protein M